jgi:hypothetical protein
MQHLWDSWLQHNREDWLLVVDNIGAIGDPTSWLPDCEHGSIILTSQDRGVRAHYRTASQVRGLEKEDALSLLIATIAPTNEDTIEIKALAETLLEVCNPTSGLNDQSLIQVCRI